MQDHKVKCALCMKPIGQKGDSPAILIDVYNQLTKEKRKARVHQKCARQQIGLK